MKFKFFLSKMSHPNFDGNGRKDDSYDLEWDTQCCSEYCCEARRGKPATGNWNENYECNDFPWLYFSSPLLFSFFFTAAAVVLVIIIVVVVDDEVFVLSSYFSVWFFFAFISCLLPLAISYGNSSNIWITNLKLENLLVFFYIF